MGIGGQIACGTEPLERVAQARKMRIRRVHDVHVRQRQPRLDACHDLADGKGTRHYPAVGRDPDESQYRGPRQANAFGTRQAAIPPLPGGRVHRRVGVMRVNEDVDVGQASLNGMPCSRARCFSSPARSSSMVSVVRIRASWLPSMSMSRHQPRALLPLHHFLEA